MIAGSIRDRDRLVNKKSLSLVAMVAACPAGAPTRVGVGGQQITPGGHRTGTRTSLLDALPVADKNCAV